MGAMGVRYRYAAAIRSGAVAVRVNIHRRATVGKILMISCKDTTFMRRSTTLADSGA